ncbi:GTPase HflX [Caldalkalibacillus salinus]|uniref:GTPase HflX n=1 Tax=Caldalkalibacillus salinus TaxID=2803787 RepID=UPI001924C627|nr:GTPase HflX [Caldalkalibacillus salinus]
MNEKETAMLVGCIRPNQTEAQVESSLHELSLLTQTAQAEAVTTVTQKRERIDPSFYIGKGKLEEMKAVIEELDIDVAIFNDELSPSQAKNIEGYLPCKVIDRTQLILDIFAMRARSKEGKLQVELAQYQYLLPRIVGKGLALSRLGGGIGTRGPGETQLEVERRHIRRRMKEIKDALAKIVSHRERYRDRRKKNDVFQVALVGYTNAGKSTLLNRLTEADTYVEDQLFATLDPTTKRLKLSSGYQVLVTDTVGFIQDLPTSLVAAFRSTLEEVVQADLILHVIDSQDPQLFKHIEVVERHLEELGAGAIPTVRIYNKKDLTPSDELIVNQHDLYLSTLSDQDIQRVRHTIEDACKSHMIKYELFLPAEVSGLMARARQQGFVVQEEWSDQDEGYYFTVYLPVGHSLEHEIMPYHRHQ